MKNRYTISLLGVLFFSASYLSAQPFAVYLNPANSQYWLIKYNTSNGSHSDEVYLTGMTGYLSGDYTTFNAGENQYCFVGYNGALYRFYSIDVINKLIVHEPVLGGNIIGIEYNCNDSLFYGLYESSGNYSIATLNAVDGSITSLGVVNNIDGAVAGSFFIDAVLNQYGFVTANGTNFELRTYQLPSGTLISSALFNDNVTGIEYSCAQNAVFGLWNNGGVYKLEQINTITGNHSTIASLNGINPGFIAEAHTTDQFGNYTFRGFNSNNELSIFTIDLSTGAVLNTFLNEDNSSGFESAHCAGVFMSVKNFFDEVCHIYPNPTVEEIKIKSPQIISSALLLTSTGMEIIAFKTINQQEFSLTLPSLQNGVYLLQLKNQEGIITTYRILISGN